MGKLHWEEGHTQLESGESAGGGWRGRGGEGEAEREREREREGRSAGQEWFSWKLAFCTLGKCCSLSAGRALSSPWVGDSSPDVNHISAHLQLICPCHLQYPPSLWWSGKEGREGGRDGGGWWTRVILLQSFCVNVISPLIAHSGGTEPRRRKRGDPSLGAVASLSHANRTAASGERLAQVLIELGANSFYSREPQKRWIIMLPCVCVSVCVCVPV